MAPSRSGACGQLLSRGATRLHDLEGYIVSGPRQEGYQSPIGGDYGRELVHLATCKVLLAASTQMHGVKLQVAISV